VHSLLACSFELAGTASKLRGYRNRINTDMSLEQLTSVDTPTSNVYRIFTVQIVSTFAHRNATVFRHGAVNCLRPIDRISGVHVYTC